MADKALETTELWAASLSLTAPNQGVIAAGFQDGEADPDVFNWLFLRYGEAILEVQQKVKSTDEKKATVTELGNVRLSNAIETAQAASPQSEAVAVNHAYFSGALHDYGTLATLTLGNGGFRQLHPAKGSPANTTSTLNVDIPSVEDIRGYYVAVMKITGNNIFLHVPFLVSWAKKTAGDTTTDYAEANSWTATLGFASGRQLLVNVNPGGSSINLQVRDVDDGTPDNPNAYEIQHLLKLRLTGKAPGA